MLKGESTQKGPQKKSQFAQKSAQKSKFPFMSCQKSGPNK